MGFALINPELAVANAGLPPATRSCRRLLAFAGIGDGSSVVAGCLAGVFLKK
ncbi:MAG: hypothetical protein WB523_03490 [Candidatus Sulfotelmatobacter sp.]